MNRAHAIAPQSIRTTFVSFLIVAAIALLGALFIAPDVAHGATATDQDAVAATAETKAAQAQPDPAKATAQAVTLKATTAGGELKAAPSGPVKKLTAQDALPGTEKQPLQAAAQATLTPATFTIFGMKYLEGRTLQAGEFTFRLSAVGVYAIPATSTLPSQLREGSSLSAAEKYALVDGGSITYTASAAQPMPEASIVGNAADGSVTFGALTFDKSALGNAATKRSQGTIFCYTVTEEVPRNADGTLKDGVEKDEAGQCTYEGVTYDGSVKRIYLYAYETGSDAAHRYVEVVPLGDAPFDAYSAEPQTGEGDGFVNVYHGATLETYMGVVHLQGEAISAGEFNFDVHEVSEAGKLIESDTVACEATEGKGIGADVPVIADKEYTKPGRVFYAVTQIAPDEAERGRVELDKTSYIITVDVTQGDDGLDPQVTAVRKQAPGSDQWVDVALTDEDSPVVWENKLLATDDAPDDGTTDGDGVAGDAAGDNATDDGTAGDAGKPDDDVQIPGAEDVDGPQAGTAAAPGAGTTPEGTEKPEKPEAGAAEAARPEAGTDASESASSATASATTPSTAASAANSMASRPASSTTITTAAEKAAEVTTDPARAHGMLSQTSDDGAPLLLTVLLVIASGAVLTARLARRAQE